MSRARSGSSGCGGCGYGCGGGNGKMVSLFSPARLSVARRTFRYVVEGKAFSQREREALRLEKKRRRTVCSRRATQEKKVRGSLQRGR